MKFNELTIRELRAQATSACIKAVRLLEESQLSQFDFLSVEYIAPIAIEENDGEEYFNVIGKIWLNDGAKVPFKANLVWLGDLCVCDLAPTEDSVEFLETFIEIDN